jgi:hypothetical protein
MYNKKILIFSFFIFLMGAKFCYSDTYIDPEQNVICCTGMNTYYDSSSGSCLCNSGYQWGAMSGGAGFFGCVLACSQNTPIPATTSGENPTCADGSYYDEQTNSCICNSTPTSTCAEGAQYYQNPTSGQEGCSCTTCGTGTTFNSTTGTCETS